MEECACDGTVGLGFLAVRKLSGLEMWFRGGVVVDWFEVGLLVSFLGIINACM